MEHALYRTCSLLFAQREIVNTNALHSTSPFVKYPKSRFFSTVKTYVLSKFFYRYFDFNNDKI